MDKTLAFGSPLGALHLVEARKELSWGGLHLERLEFLSLFGANYIFSNVLWYFVAQPRLNQPFLCAQFLQKYGKIKAFG
jgi:hypothetical protein